MKVLCVQQRDEQLVVCFNENFLSQNIVWEFAASPNDPFWFLHIVAQFHSSIWMHMPPVSSLIWILLRVLLPVQMRKHLWRLWGLWVIQCKNSRLKKLVFDFVERCILLWAHSWVLSNSRNGWVSSTIRGENFPNWFTIPRNFLRSETECGTSIRQIASTLSGSAQIPITKVYDILAQLTGAAVFSKLDANSKFWQIPLSDESKLLTSTHPWKVCIQQATVRNLQCTRAVSEKNEQNIGRTWWCSVTMC